MHSDLFTYTPSIPNLHFKGETYNAAFDCERLSDQQRRVYEVMRGGRWRTLREIASITGDPEASISARLRDFSNHAYLRQFFRMTHRRRGEGRHGLFEYQVTHIAP